MATPNPANPPDGPPAAQEWIALLGRRDEPTDGVEDYCTFLGRALAAHGVTLRQARVEWDKHGWRTALRSLQSEAAGWRDKRVILQYTALAWSRRGFPLGALKALAILRQAGANAAVMFHEPERQAHGSRVIDHLRGACQDFVVRHLYAGAGNAIFADPLANISWLPGNGAKAVFIPIGANIPAPPAAPLAMPAAVPDIPSASNLPASAPRTIVVFCVGQPPYQQQEVGDIAHAVRFAAKQGLPLRLVLIGKGTPEAKGPLEAALRGVATEISHLGLRSAEEVSRTLAASDAMLCVRGKLYPRRGSALAGIACGLPLVGFAGASDGTPLEEAGLALAPYGDREALANALAEVLSDPERRQQLRDRSARAHQRYFSWERIASQMIDALSAGAS